MTANHWEPDYAVPVGEVLAEYMHTRGMHVANVAHGCGVSVEHIRGILCGAEPLDDGIARHLERIFGLDASVWIGIDKRYWQHKKEPNNARVCT